MKPALLEQLTATPAKVDVIALDVIPTSPATQLREGRDAATVAAYAEAYLAGANMPPVVVFIETGKDGDTYHLADGHHRVAAAKKAELTEINVITKHGTRRDAILYAAAANAHHGLPLTNADKRKIVATLLSDPEWQQWSDRELADRCHVSPTLVGKLRKKTPGAEAPKRKTKAGRTITVAPTPAAAPQSEQFFAHDAAPSEPETLQPPKPLADRRAARLREVICQRLREAKIKTPSADTLMALALITGCGPIEERFSHELVMRADALMAQHTADEIATVIATGDHRLQLLPAIPDLCRVFGLDHDSLRIWVEREISE